LFGCKKPTEDRAAIRAAVVEYLAGRGMSDKMMDIDVKNVTFKGENADAQVSFRGKGGADTGGFLIAYSLRFQNGKWTVTGKKMAGMGVGQPHAGAGMGANPHGAAGAGGGAAVTPDRLPPSGGQMKMPPGHPAVPKQ
jgi:hypothetical protein